MLVSTVTKRLVQAGVLEALVEALQQEQEAQEVLHHAQQVGH